MDSFDFETYVLSPTAIGFSLFYAMMMFFNIILNSFLIFLAKRGKLLNNTPNILVVNLAIADLGLGLANFPIWLSNAIAGYWISKRFGCYWNGVACSYFVFNTVITLFLITAERYFSIVLQKRIDKSILIKGLIMFWILGGAYAALPFLSSTKYMVQSSGTYCAPYWSSTEPSAFFLKIVICSMISMTVMLMAFAYYRIISAFRSSQASFKTPSFVSPSQISNKPNTDPTTPSPGISPRLINAFASPHVSLNASSASANPTSEKKVSLNNSTSPLLKSWGTKTRETNNTKPTPSQIAARKNEKMLLIRAIAVVLTFSMCWCMYLAVWVLTWAHTDPVPLVVDGISAFLVSLIGVLNPLLTFSLDKRYNALVLKALGVKNTFSNAGPESNFPTMRNKN